MGLPKQFFWGNAPGSGGIRGSFRDESRDFRGLLVVGAPIKELLFIVDLKYD